MAARTPYSALPMPALCSDPAKLEAADPLAPVAPFNAARQAASLLRHDTGRRVAVVLEALRGAGVGRARQAAPVHPGKQHSNRNRVPRPHGEQRLPGDAQRGSRSDHRLLSIVPGIGSRITAACQACIAFQPRGGGSGTSAFWDIDPADSIGLEALTDKGRSLAGRGRDCAGPAARGPGRCGRPQRWNGAGSARAALLRDVGGSDRQHDETPGIFRHLPELLQLPGGLPGVLLQGMRVRDRRVRPSAGGACCGARPSAVW
ncbi:MAG: hypothetical protein MZU91_14645 [Desulfosudis oleivorans]|nr:hypothetical protein [Desulfosudis oleivorans]